MREEEEEEEEEEVEEEVGEKWAGEGAEVYTPASRSASEGSIG